MRKIVSWLLLSLDGVMEAPETWQSPYATDEVNAAAGGQMNDTDTLLFGRRTYEDLARFWPHQPDSNPFAAVLNHRPKLVVSNLLRTADWQHTRIIRGDVRAQLVSIKALPG